MGRRIPISRLALVDYISKTVLLRSNVLKTGQETRRANWQREKKVTGSTNSISDVRLTL